MISVPVFFLLKTLNASFITIKWLRDVKKTTYHNEQMKNKGREKKHQHQIVYKQRLLFWLHSLNQQFNIFSMPNLPLVLFFFSVYFYARCNDFFLWFVYFTFSLGLVSILYSCRFLFSLCFIHSFTLIMDAYGFIRRKCDLSVYLWNAKEMSVLYGLGVCNNYAYPLKCSNLFFFFIFQRRLMEEKKCFTF